MPSLGYLFDHPAAVRARTDPRNWPMTLLAPEPVAAPAEYDTDCGPTLDQDAVGACVAFAATGIKSWQEKADSGAWLFTTATAFTAYDWLKHGHGAWPGDGIEEEGSYAQAVWRMAKTVGIPSTVLPKPISAYYQLTGTPGDEAWNATQQTVIMQYGPLSISSIWPTNWFSTATAEGLMRYPSSSYAGGHMYIRKGWTSTGPVGPVSWGYSPTGRYWRHRNSWGAWGHRDGFGRSGEFLLPFEADGAYIALQLGLDLWKTLDTPDAPTPTPPGDIVKAYDAIPRTFDCAVGTQFYRDDGTTPLVKLSSGGNDLYSPCAYDATNYWVRVSIGGVPQLAVVRRASCTDVKPYGPDCSLVVAAERKRWTDWLATSPK